MAKYVVHLDVSADLEARLKSVQQKIASQQVIPQHPLHVTLYSCQFTDGALVESLRKIRQSPFVLEPTVFDYFDEDAFVVRINSDGAKKLHYQVLVALCPYINREELTSVIQPPGFESNIRNFGSPYVARHYSPHVTIAKVSKDVVVPDVSLCAWRAESFVLSKSVNGKYERLEEFKLKF